MHVANRLQFELLSKLTSVQSIRNYIAKQRTNLRTMESCRLNTLLKSYHLKQHHAHTKSVKEGEPFVCTICLENIPEPMDDSKGVDVIFCKGAYDSWLHI